MGIVLITMPGAAKRNFANTLHRKIDGGVDLVIIQRSKKDTPFSRIKRLFSVGFSRLPRELWYAILLRLRPHTRKTLEYFHLSSPTSSDAGFLPKTLIVDSINSNEVHKVLTDLSPDLIIVWGSKVLQQHIIASAKNMINLHIGKCPKYRGTLANQNAVLCDDRMNIGATVHRVAEHVDAGDIIQIIEPDMQKPPRELFRDLNDRAQLACIEIAARLHAGESLPSTPQGNIPGKNLLMRDWTPSMRYRVAKKVCAWEREYSPVQKAQKTRTV